MPITDPLDVTLFSDAFRDSPVASVILAADGNVLFWNSAAERLFGWSRDEVIGRPLPFIPSDRMEEHRQMRRRDMEGQGSSGRHITRLRKDGSLIHLSVSTAPIRGVGGEVAGILAVYTDISAQKQAEETARMRQSLANEQLDQLERFYTTAPIGLGFLDTDLRFVRVNERLAQIHGRSVADHIGKSLEEVSPDFAARIGDVCRAVISSGLAVIEREVQAATPALPGIERDWLVSFHPLKQPDGSVLGVTTVVSDITERKRFTDKLRDQERLLRLVIDGMPGLVSYVGPDYRYRFNNHTYAEWHHRPVTDFAGKALDEVLGPEVFALIKPDVDRALKGEPRTIEHQATYAGQVRDLRAIYVPDQGSDGKVHGIVALIQDITEQKRYEQALSRSEERFRRIVEIAAEGIWMLDTEGRTTFANPRMGDLLGVTPEEMMGHTFADYMDPEEYERGWRHFEGRKHGDRGPSDYRFRRKDGALIWLDITAAPIHEEDGSLSGVLGMCTDVTERKQREQQHRQTQKLESLGILAGGIAHDFNNLLVGIMGNASLAADTLDPLAPGRPLLDNVLAASERAAQLTRQLLAYAGRDHGASEPLDLARLVRELTPLLGSSVSKMVELSLSLNAVPLVQGDSAQLQQVVMNLVINAAESVPAGKQGRVLVSVSQHRLTKDDHRCAVIPIAGHAENYVALTVADNGAGMDAATQSRIFDPFFTTKFAGRGLGLSAVLGIVRGHRGTLTLWSSPGEGSRFSVLLPASDTPAPAESSGPAKSAISAGTGTILVVDDEPAVRSLAQQVLEKAGYAVLLADNGQAALDVLDVHSEVRAVLLDLTMPVMNGDEAAQIMRERRPELPLILSSGYSESEAVERFGKDILSGFLQKPYTSQRLAAKIAEVLA